MVLDDSANGQSVVLIMMSHGAACIQTGGADCSTTSTCTCTKLAIRGGKARAQAVVGCCILRPGPYPHKYMVLGSKGAGVMSEELAPQRRGGAVEHHRGGSASQCQPLKRAFPHKQPPQVGDLAHN
jgi:hypothetical protein